MHLVDSYYRYYAWQYVRSTTREVMMLTDLLSFDVAPRREVQPLLHTLYPNGPRSQNEPSERIRLHPQELALLFIIFAMGARHALEWEQGEGPDEDYSWLARSCLTKGDFMTHHTICGVQTLVRSDDRCHYLSRLNHFSLSWLPTNCKCMPKVSIEH